MSRLLKCASCAILAFCTLAVNVTLAEKPDVATELENRAKELVPMMDANFQLIPPITDRAFWDEFAKTSFARSAVRNAESTSAQPIPVVTDELYLEFSQNGNRSNYQNARGRRNIALRYLLYAECAENQGRFLPRIEEFLRVYAADKSWVLPAHDGNLDNFNGKYNVDLVSSATSWELALLGQILGEKLSPESRALLDEQLRVRCFEPYKNCILKKSPRMWWVTGKNNWNAVCLSGVTGAALANLKSPEERAWFAAAAEKFIQNSTEGYTDDGYCSEGVGYWCYGFDHQIKVAELLRRATADQLRLLDDPKLRKVAWYGFSIEILPSLVPSFADCGMNARPSSLMCAFLNRYYDFHIDAYDNRIQDPLSEITDFGIYYLGRDAFRPSAADSANIPFDLRTWFDSSQVLICRPNDFQKCWANLADPAATQASVKNLDGFAVAMKAGHNGELHNHNDVGSYVLVYRGTRPCLDLGGEVYTRRTFSAQRYESDLLNSWGHNVPVVAGKLQKTGRDATSENLETNFTDEKDTFVFDLQKAYQVPECVSLKRTFIYDRAGRSALTVEDSVKFTSPQTFETAIVTIEPWQRAENAPNLVLLGTGDATIQAKIEVLIDGRLSDTWKLQESSYESDFSARPNARRLGIVLDNPVSDAVVRITYTPKN